MAPALTAEPLSPKEKLTSTASPAAATRQSSRKLESPPSGSASSSDCAAAAAAVTTTTTTIKKPLTPATPSTRVTRSKDAAAQRTASPNVQPNNKRRSVNNNNNNNNNNSSGGGVKQSSDQMGLSAANSHTNSTDSSVAANNNNINDTATATAAPPTAPPVAVAVAVAEHNNNCKENSTAELLAHLTSDFEEAISAEICLRKTLPEVSLGKETPTVAAVTAATAVQEAEAEANLLLAAAASAAATSSQMDAAQSTSAAAAAAVVAAAAAAVAPHEEQQVATIEAQLEGLPPRISTESSATATASEDNLEDNIEERLSQLDGSALVVTPVAEISAAALEAMLPLPLPLPTTPGKQEQQLQQHQLQLAAVLASPQRPLLTSQSNASISASASSSINFLKDGAAGAVLEDQDIEEVLKALKTLDGSHVNPDTICDFNFFNEVCFLNNEEEPNVATSSHNQPMQLPAMASGLEAADSKLSLPPPPRPWQESHAELEQQQHVLVRKIDFLLRRMRKFQARQMCRHASDEVAGIFEWSARSSNKAPTPVRSAKLSEQQATVMSIVSGRPAVNFWLEQRRPMLPAAQMSQVLRHIETVARQQQVCHTIGSGSATLASSSSWYSAGTAAAVPGKRPRKQLPTTTTDAAAAPAATTLDVAATPRADEIVPNFDSYVTSELTHVAGLLHTELRELQNAMDSDATESSSGGESADEMVNYNNSQQLSLSITRRAVWRYSRDRAAIALRWSWLCAQLADLDMKIRQHSDLYNELSRSKGEVALESQTPSKNTTVAATAANGYKEESEWLCSRTRPLNLSEFRKRKLFQTTNMHTISKKAARPSNIKCGCQWPQIPCTLCTGRADPTAPRDLPETLMPQSRVALLDGGYHPVLSFANDISQSVHLEAISRQPDWQYRVMRCQAKAIVKSVLKAEREALATIGGGGGAGAGRRLGETGKRRYVRRKERNNPANNNNNNNNNHSGGGGGVLDSGNGTGTATTSSTSTPTTTPFTANTSARKQRQAATVAPTSIGSSNSTSRLPSSSQSLHNASLISSSGSGAKKQRKNNNINNSIQQQQHSAHSSSSSNNNIHNNQPYNCDSNSSSRFHSHSSNNNHEHQWESSSLNRGRSRNSSPTPTGSSGGKQQRHERSTDRRSRMVYDIDNIVIPYSVAAATRVEILPYKEIPTPKWRVVDSDSEKQEQQLPDGAKERELNAEAVKSTKVLSNGCATQAGQKTTELAFSSSLKTPAEEPNGKKTPPKAVAAAGAPKVNGVRLKEKGKDMDELHTKEPQEEIAAKPQQIKHNTNTLVNGNGLPVEQNKEQQPKQEIAKITKANNSRKNKVNNVRKNNKVAAIVEAGNKKVETITTSTTTTKLKEVSGSKRPKLEKLTVASAAVEAAPAAPVEAAAAATPPIGDKVAAAGADSVDEFDIEDLSDEAYIARHHRALLEERRRFETFLKFPWSTRSRANRRVDSRAESSGANTPDPPSPAPQQLAGSLGADNESIPSPLAQPLDALNETAGAASSEPLTSAPASAAGGSKSGGAAGGSKSGGAARQERRRTTSSKLKEFERRSATPDLRETPLFEPLHFPLSEEVYQKLLAEQNAPPKSARAKRAKSKSLSSNCDGGTATGGGGSRRSSKAKANASTLMGSSCKLALPHINGDDAFGQQQQSQDEVMDYDEPLAADELMLEEDDDDDYPKHHLAPQDDDDEQQLPQNDEAALYDACIDAYIGEHAMDEELDEADDPFMDDDPNDPEWKRGLGMRSERMRKRV